jgi:hypothetical protein
VTTIDWLVGQQGFLATFGSPAYSQVAKPDLLQFVSLTRHLGSDLPDPQDQEADWTTQDALPRWRSACSARA